MLRGGGQGGPCCPDGQRWEGSGVSRSRRRQRGALGCESYNSMKLWQEGACGTPVPDARLPTALGTGDLGSLQCWSPAAGPGLSHAQLADAGCVLWTDLSREPWHLLRALQNPRWTGSGSRAVLVLPRARAFDGWTQMFCWWWFSLDDRFTVNSKL